MNWLSVYVRKHLQYWNIIPSASDNPRRSVAACIRGMLLGKPCGRFICGSSISALNVFRKWPLFVWSGLHSALSIRSEGGVGSTKETTSLPRPCFTPLRKLSSFQVSRRSWYSQVRWSSTQRAQAGRSSAITISGGRQQIAYAYLPVQRSRQSLQETQPLRECLTLRPGYGDDSESTGPVAILLMTEHFGRRSTRDLGSTETFALKMDRVCLVVWLYWRGRRVPLGLWT